MKRIFALFLGSLLYMEIVYHLACFGIGKINPMLAIPVCIFIAGIQALLVGFLRRKANKIITWILFSLDFLLFASQLVYMKVFKQPLLMAAIQNAGGDALSNYWREALYAILLASGYIILLAVPLVLYGIFLKKKWLTLNSCSIKGRIAALCSILVGGVAFFCVLFVGRVQEAEFYEDYKEFYDPNTTMEQFGVMPAILRDMSGDFVPMEVLALETWNDEASYTITPTTDVPKTEEMYSTVSDNKTDTTVSGNKVINSTVSGNSSVDTSQNVVNINFQKLEELSTTKELQTLTEYLKTVEPTNKNEYTGMFEGYNLIYLTAEGFSPYAVDETLTPTLYSLIHSGFTVPDYYVPLWQTSTSDGEYVNLTGLIPNQQFSMKRSAVNDMAFSLPAFFEKEGVKSYAYHNNTLSYYDRHLSHPNLGYDFKASKLGDLDETEWGAHIFPMENANAWPASDLDMMKATIPEYINDERFHVYYMTVSGHMNYNFTGNQMSRKNRDAVADLPYSEEGRAYISCNIELDKALEYLIAELDKAGKLDKTVICLSADHYPYAMDMTNLEELAGKPLEGTLELYRNSLILWNSAMDTVEVSKTCSALDLMPTLLNLFGFDYDSRLFVGKDILSDSPSMVVFSDRSFITDKIMYYKKDKRVEYRTEEITDEEYLDKMKTQVKNMNKISAGILNNDYYRYVNEAIED